MKARLPFDRAAKYRKEILCNFSRVCPLCQMQWQDYELNDHEEVGTAAEIFKFANALTLLSDFFYSYIRVCRYLTATQPKARCALCFESSKALLRR